MSQKSIWHFVTELCKIFSLNLIMKISYGCFLH